MSYGPFNPMLSLSAVPSTSQLPDDKPRIEKQHPEQADQEDLVEENESNQTIYVNRLNERISIEELRDALFTLFSQYGKILSIVVKRNLKMRGQAFIIFENVEQATNAKDAIHKKFYLFDKLVRVQFAREQSDVITKSKGTFEQRERKPLSEKIAEHKAKINEKRKVEMAQRLLNSHMPPTLSIPPSNQYLINKERAKHSTQPNKVLFVEGLHHVDYNQLEMLFRNFIGFREMRGVRPKGIAFVEFDDELKATHCLNELNNQYFHDVQLQISYQNK